MEIRNLESMSGIELQELVDRIFENAAGKDKETVYAELQVVCDEMNARGRRIAKKYRRRFKPFTPRDLTFNRESQMKDVKH